MAKRLLQNDLALWPLNPNRATRDMLIHALEHPDPDVRLEAARRMCDCLLRKFAMPLAGWLLREMSAPDHLAKRAANEILTLPECQERTMAILALSRHPSQTVQLVMTKLLTRTGETNCRNIAQ